MQRRVAVLVDGFDFGLLPDQKLDHAGLAVPGRCVQRRFTSHGRFQVGLVQCGDLHRLCHAVWHDLCGFVFALAGVFL